MCRSIISLSKITHQMWHDDPFSQRNETTKGAVRMEVKVDGKEMRLGKIEKGEVGNIEESS